MPKNLHMSIIYRNFAMDFENELFGNEEKTVQKHKNELFRNIKIEPSWHEAKQKNLEIKTC